MPKLDGRLKFFSIEVRRDSRVGVGANVDEEVDPSTLD